MKTIKKISLLSTMVLMAALFGTGVASAANYDSITCVGVAFGIQCIPLVVLHFSNGVDFSKGILASSYDATILQNAIYKTSQSDEFQQNENRLSAYGAFEIATSQVDQLLPATTLENIKKSSLQPTKINVFAKEAYGSGAARKCTGTGNGLTAQITPSYATFAEEFGMSALEIAQNQYNYEEIFASRIQNKLRSFYKRFENAAIAKLESLKSHGNGTAFHNYHYAKQVSDADWDISVNRAANLMGKIQQEFQENDYDGPIVIIGNPAFTRIWGLLNSQGAGTAINLNVGGDFIYKKSNSITNNTGVAATCYAFRPGMFGVLSWTNQLSRAGADIGTDKWSVFSEPRFDITMEQKYKVSCADSSGSISGGEADLVEGFVDSVDLAFISAYSSDANNSGIYKYELSTTTNVHSGSGS